MREDMMKWALTGLAAGVCLSAAPSEVAMSKCSKSAPVEKSADQTDPDSEDANCGGGASCETPGDCSDVSQLDEREADLTQKRLQAASNP